MKRDLQESHEARLKSLERVAPFYDALAQDFDGLNCNFSADSIDLNIHLYGGKRELGRAFQILRRGNFMPESRPTDEKAQEFCSRFKRDDGASVYLFFSSTVCRRIQIGTRTVEEPIYEIQCDDGHEQAAVPTEAEAFA